MSQEEASGRCRNARNRRFQGNRKEGSGRPPPKARCCSRRGRRSQPACLNEEAGAETGGGRSMETLEIPICGRKWNWAVSRR